MMGDDWPEQVGTRPSPDDDETQMLPPDSSSNGAAANVLDALRAVRERHEGEHTFDLEVPGWQGLLALRLGPIPAARITRIAERAQTSRSPERAFNEPADTLIAACRAVLGRASRDDDWTVLPSVDGEPVRLDEALAEQIGLKATRAREVVRELFARANAPDLALGVAASGYIEWASDVNAEIDEATLGES